MKLKTFQELEEDIRSAIFNIEQFLEELERGDIPTLQSLAPHSLNSVKIMESFNGAPFTQKIHVSGIPGELEIVLSEENLKSGLIARKIGDHISSGQGSFTKKDFSNFVSSKLFHKVRSAHHSGTLKSFGNVEKLHISFEEYEALEGDSSNWVFLINGHICVSPSFIDLDCEDKVWFDVIPEKFFLEVNRWKDCSEKTAHCLLSSASSSCEESYESST